MARSEESALSLGKGDRETQNRESMGLEQELESVDPKGNSRLVVCQLITSIVSMMIIGWPLQGWSYIKLILVASRSSELDSSIILPEESLNGLFVSATFLGFTTAPLFGFIADHYGPVILGSIGWGIFALHAICFCLTAHYNPESLHSWRLAFCLLGMVTPAFAFSHNQTSMKVKDPTMKLLSLNLILNFSGATVCFYSSLAKAYVWFNCPPLASSYLVILMIIYLPLFISYVCCFIVPSLKWRRHQRTHASKANFQFSEAIGHLTTAIRQNPVELAIVFLVLYVPQTLCRGYYNMLLLDRTSKEFAMRIAPLMMGITLLSGLVGCLVVPAYPPTSINLTMLFVTLCLGWSVQSLRIGPYICRLVQQLGLPASITVESIWLTGGITLAIAMPFVTALRFTWLSWKMGDTNVAVLFGLSAQLAGFSQLLLNIPNNNPETQVVFDIICGILFPVIQILGILVLMAYDNADNRKRKAMRIP